MERGQKTDASRSALRVNSWFETASPLPAPKPNLSKRSNKASSFSFVTDDS